MVRLTRERLSHECPSLLQGSPTEHQLDTQVITHAELSLEIIQDAGLPSHLQLALGAWVGMPLELTQHSSLPFQLSMVRGAATQLSLESFNVYGVHCYLGRVLNADLQLGLKVSYDACRP